MPLIERKPPEKCTFEDIEAARRYNKEIKAWSQNVSKSFVSVAKRWEVTEGKVLDVGTGTGLLAIGFAARIPGVEVIGLDLSDAALEVARDNVRESDEPLRVSFETGNAEDMPFKDQEFDLVISSNTLRLVKNPLKMFNEIQRVLKPDGRFLISDFRRSWLGILSGHFRSSYSPQEARDLLRQSNLQNWRMEDHFLWLSIVSED